MNQVHPPAPNPDAAPPRPEQQGAFRNAAAARPVFAFAFCGGAPRLLDTFEEVDEAGDGADFCWVHLNLANQGNKRWLMAQAFPADVLGVVSEPVQRGRLFSDDTLLYGHMRDIRNDPDGETLQVGAVSLLAAKGLLVTGRRLPLRAVQALFRRVQSGTVAPHSPFELLTAYFAAINDVGEDVLEDHAEDLAEIETMLLKRRGHGRREELLLMRSQAIRLARDMTYKRAAMIQLGHSRPPVFPADEFKRFKRQVARYEALVEDVHDFAERCQFLLDEYRAQVAEDTNRNVYALALMSAVFLPATLVAGLWGMNVEDLPFAGADNGYWYVLGVIAVCLTAVALVLRRLKIV